MKYTKGFTLIELVVVVAIIAVLSGIILFAVSTYINKGKDANVSGNLNVLVPAGEVFYTATGNSYAGFCTSSVVLNAEGQMPAQASASQDCPSSGNPAGVCCMVAGDGNSWAACVREFTTSNNAYCVDSRGMKKELVGNNSACNGTFTQCP